MVADKFAVNIPDQSAGPCLPIRYVYQHDFERPAIKILQGGGKLQRSKNNLGNRLPTTRGRTK